MLPDQLRAVLLWSVLVVWVANFVAGLVPPLQYEPVESINGIFMAIFGGVLALGARRERDGE